MLLHPVLDLLDGAAPLPQLGGVPHQQALAQGGAQGIHRVQLSLGVFGPQLLHGYDGGLIGSGQAGGEGQNQDVPARLEQGFQGLGVLGGVDGVGGGRVPLAQALIKSVGVHIPVVGVVVVDLAVQHKAQRDHLNVKLPDHFLPQVGGGVGENNKI